MKYDFACLCTRYEKRSAKASINNAKKREEGDDDDDEDDDTLSLSSRTSMVVGDVEQSTITKDPKDETLQY